MTLLEVVLSIVLLGLVAATLAGVMGSLQRTQARHRHQLAAAEVANALILQHIDDHNSLPSELAPVPYGDSEYRFTFSERPTTILMDARALEDATYSEKARRIDRVRLLSVKVWLAEDFGGSFRYDELVPHASMTRLYDPLAFANPDSVSTRLQTAEGLNELVQTMMDPTGTAGGSSGSQEDQP